MLGEFTPVESALGGLLIGLSAASVLLVHGRVAGVSGICGGLRTARGADLRWRLLFVGGLVAGAGAGAALNPRDELPTLPALGVGRYALAGALVGAGTRLGNGCTSGHGVCGLARGSRRSLAAVATFMSTGFAATSVGSLLAEPVAVAAVAPFTLAPLREARLPAHLPALALAALTAPLALTAARGHVTANALLCGVTFGLGLAVSGMTHPAKVVAFLDVTGRSGPWDPSLAFVMAGGLLGSAVGCGRAAGGHLQRDS